MTTFCWLVDSWLSLHLLFVNVFNALYRMDIVYVNIFIFCQLFLVKKCKRNVHTRVLFTFQFLSFCFAVGVQIIKWKIKNNLFVEFLADGWVGELKVQAEKCKNLFIKLFPIKLGQIVALFFIDLFSKKTRFLHFVGTYHSWAKIMIVIVSVKHKSAIWNNVFSCFVCNSTLSF